MVRSCQRSIGSARVSCSSKRRHIAIACCCVCMQVKDTGHAQRLNMFKQRPRKWFFRAEVNFSRLSRGGCYGMTNADWLISPRAAQLLPSNPRARLFKRAGQESMPRGSVSLMFTKIMDWIPPRFFLSVARLMAQVHERSTFPQSFTGSLSVVCYSSQHTVIGDMWTYSLEG